MNRGYGNVDKKIWKVKYVHEQDAYDKNSAGFVNVETFQQKNLVPLQVEKMCG